MNDVGALLTVLRCGRVVCIAVRGRTADGEFGECGRVGYLWVWSRVEKVGFPSKIGRALGD